MKIINVEPDFKPVALVLETQEEVDKIYALCNRGCILGAIGIDDERRKYLREMLPSDINRSRKWYDKLCSFQKVVPAPPPPFPIEPNPSSTNRA